MPEQTRVDPGGLYNYLRSKFAGSAVDGYVPADGAAYGIKTGSPDEWARFGLAVAKQESNLNPASYNAQDPGGSAGLFQFGQGQTTFTQGQDQFNPQASADAFVRSVQHYVGDKGTVSALGATFGSIARPNETLQHMGWAQKQATEAGGAPSELSPEAIVQAIKEAPKFASAGKGPPAGWTPRNATEIANAPAPSWQPGGSTLISDAPPEAAAAPAEPEPGPAQPFISTFPVSPISEDAVQQHEIAGQQDPSVAAAGTEQKKMAAAYEAGANNYIDAHSAAVTPEDQRVTRRVNPDTGSIRISGKYFVPGDAVHSRFLSGIDPENVAKLPWLQDAIASGGSFGFDHYSAPEQAGALPEERPTAESRTFEQLQSTAGQRIAGTAAGQWQRETIIPQQLVVTEPKFGRPHTVSLEGYGADNIVNNAQHVIDAAKNLKIAIPYQNTGANFHADMAGYITNQQHGYRGDGSGPMIGANGVPVDPYVRQSGLPAGARYVPHMLTPQQAEFINTAMNIVPSKKEAPEGAHPTFGQRAQWLAQVNQGFIGQERGLNRLREEIDRKHPEIGRRGKKGQITRHEPWSKAKLEATWRRFRVENIRPQPGGLTSIRARGQPFEPARAIPAAPMAVHAAAEFKAPLRGRGRAAPIAENPEVGAPLGEIPRRPEKLVGPFLLPNRLYRMKAAPALSLSRR